MLIGIAAWENVVMPMGNAIPRSTRGNAALLTAGIVVLAILSSLVPTKHVVLHNVLHHLNVIPFMLAGLIFGWRGALYALLAASLLQTPSIYQHWHQDPVDAQDQVVELSIFGLSGVVAGVLADRERLQRLRVETTRRELEVVHTALQQNVEQLKHAERLSAAGQLSASLAHEIRNPLASISGAAGILGRGQVSEADRSECLDILKEESARLNRLLTGFLDFARPRAPRYQLAEPVALACSVLGLAQHAAAQDQVVLRHEMPERLPDLQCDPEQIKQVLLNLVLNAVQSLEHGGSVVLRCFSSDAAVVFEVSDTGRGIRPEDRERIFDPFFTTREHGTGLGLSIAANIAAQHEGSLTCLPNEHGPGTTFRLSLPRPLAHADVREPMQRMVNAHEG